MEAIFGIINFSKNTQVNIDILKKMGQVLSDSRLISDRLRIWINKNVGFGGINSEAVNFSAEDLIASNKDKTIHCIFIGEFHNFRELKQELAQKEFKTNGKAELIIHLYEECGEEFPVKLNGLFCCAIWDENKEKFILAIDRFSGIRRMHYVVLNDSLIFGSEIRSILASNRVPRDINFSAISDFLTIGYIYGYQTAFKYIKRLPQAHILVIDTKSKQTKLKRYWDMKFLIHKNGGYERIFELYKKAVERRLEGLNPVAAYLSGGLDSSTNTAMLKQIVKGDIHTFGVGFDDKNIDESDYAELVARYCNVKYHKTIFTDDISLRLPEIIWYLEEPFCDGSFVPTFLLCKLTKEYTDIVISGDGPDHLFGRYSWLANNANLFEHLPFSSLFKKLFDYYKLNGKSNGMLSRLAYLGQFSHMPMKQAHMNCYTTCLTETIKQKLYTDDFRKSIASDFDKNNADFGIYPYGKVDKINELIYADVLINGTFAVFNKMGRMANAHSLIVREPFFDNELVEFINTLPVSLKHTSGFFNILRGKKTNKVAMRKYISGKLLPVEALSKKKQGFMLPANFWLKDKLFNHAKRIVLSQKARKREYFDYSVIEEIFQDYHKDKELYGGIIFLLLVLELWHILFIDNNELCRPEFELSML